MRGAPGRGDDVASREGTSHWYNRISEYRNQPLEAIMNAQKQTNDNRDIPCADFTVWRVMKAKQRQHDREVTHAYNLRTRQRPATKH
jgi:hypothetical protein